MAITTPHAAPKTAVKDDPTASTPPEKPVVNPLEDSIYPKNLDKYTVTAPCDWGIYPVDDKIYAKNALTNEQFYGTMSEFKVATRG